LVASLARPGANVTGFSIEPGSFSGKMLQVFQEARPGLSRVVLLYTPANPSSKVAAERTVPFAQQLGVALELVAVNAPEDLESAFATTARTRPDGLMVHATPVLFGNARRIAA